MKVSDVLFVLYMATIVGLIVSATKRQMSVRGTRMRYLAKTFMIIFLILHALFLLPLAIAFMRESDSLGEQVFWIIYPILIGSLYVKFTIDVILDDEDDWFNDVWKKAKRGVKSILKVRKLRPSAAN